MLNATTTTDYRAHSMPIPETWVTVAEAAALLRCHPETIRRAVRTGELPATRLGYRTLRIQRVDLESWVKSKGYIPAK
jgi:excisionase family DNA binding protein